MSSRTGKVVKVTTVTERNGDVIEKRLVRHQDGKTSIKNKKIACGVPTVRPAIAREVTSIRKPQGGRLTTSAKKKMQKAAVTAVKTPPPKTAVLPTIREEIVYDETVYVAGIYVEKTKKSFFNTTNKVPSVLREFGARNGSHVDQFQKDFEILNAGLKSANLEGTGGGGKALPLPIAQIQAQDRLKAFNERDPQSFLVCRLLLVDSVEPKLIPVPEKQKKNGGRRKLIQNSISNLANFYSPKRNRPDRNLVDFAKKVQSDLLGRGDSNRYPEAKIKGYLDEPKRRKI